MPGNVKSRPPVTSRKGGPDTCTITTLKIPNRLYRVTDLPAELAALVHVDPVTGCWLWRGPVDRDGYGRYRGELAHRVIYRELAGAIPDGRELDHLCHTRDKSCPGGKTDPHRRCVYPADLEPVTGLQNSLRGRSFAAINAAKTRCDHGHPFDLFGTYFRPNGHRDCRVCIRIRVAKYKRRKRQRAAVTALAPGADLERAA